MVDGTEVEPLRNFVLQSNGEAEELSDSLAVFGDHFGHLRSELDFVEALLPDDIWLGVVEPVEVAFLQVLLKLIGRVVREVKFLH